MSTPAPVTIVSCGIGNIKSVRRMFEAVDGEARIAEHPDEIADSRKLVLPGVGAFDAGMRLLEEGGWIEPINQAVRERGVPVLGICLGMQLLCRGSEEGQLPGLGWIEADVRILSRGQEGKLKLPHMGWSVTVPARPNPLIPNGGDEQRFYYVHKYGAVCDSADDVLATADYGGPFTAAISHGHVYGVQFHPEKSHRFGKALFKRFLDLAC